MPLSSIYITSNFVIRVLPQLSETTTTNESLIRILFETIQYIIKAVNPLDTKIINEYINCIELNPDITVNDLMKKTSELIDCDDYRNSLPIRSIAYSNCKYLLFE